LEVFNRSLRLVVFDSGKKAFIAGVADDQVRRGVNWASSPSHRECCFPDVNFVLFSRMNVVPSRFLAGVWLGYRQDARRGWC
jgi:hypothetical protein